MSLVLPYVGVKPILVERGIYKLTKKVYFAGKPR